VSRGSPQPSTLRQAQGKQAPIDSAQGKQGKQAPIDSAQDKQGKQAPIDSAQDKQGKQAPIDSAQGKQGKQAQNLREPYPFFSHFRLKPACLVLQLDRTGHVAGFQPDINVHLVIKYLWPIFKSNLISGCCSWICYASAC